MTLPANETAAMPPVPRRSSAWSLTLLALLLMAGLVGGAWAMHWYLSRDSAVSAPAVPVDSRGYAVAGVATTPGAPDAVSPGIGATAPVAVDPALAYRLADLEARLARIGQDAQLAGSNAARAETMLVAAATRRALDRGLPLGYLENELRLRFGQDQPRAVASVIAAARRPVTIDQLRTEFEDLAPRLGGELGPDVPLWERTRAALSSLVVVREAGKPSPQPARRIDRARQTLAAGYVGPAVAEVEALPARDLAAGWLARARRYHEARRALDLLESAAILDARAAMPGAMMPPPSVPVPPAPLAAPQAGGTG